MCDYLGLPAPSHDLLETFIEELVLSVEEILYSHSVLSRRMVVLNINDYST